MTPTADATTAFFSDLGSRGNEPSLGKISGTVRFDLVAGKKTERWLVAIRKGDLSVSHRNVAADSVLRASKALFERVASGQTNILTALLRGEAGIQGDYRLVVVVLQRLLPGPLDAREPRRTAGYARRQR